MAQPSNWTGVAFNQATESANQIHSDEMAKAYGFKGGLVPGVTISSYLMHPAAAAWGEDWLRHGKAHVEVKKPLYDGYTFEVVVDEATDSRYAATLIDQEGVRCAHGQFELDDQDGVPPVRRNDPLLPRDHQPPPVSRDVLLALRETGMGALPARWSKDNNMANYVADAHAMAPLHRFAPDGEGFANGAFLLGLTNWVLAGNTYMNPWVHMQTDSRFFAPVPEDTRLAVECAVDDLFEKRGHEFVDVTVNAFVDDTSEAVMSATLRAIYRLRAPGE